MAYKIKHKETGLFFCRAKGLSDDKKYGRPYSREWFLNRHLSKRGRIYESLTEKHKIQGNFFLTIIKDKRAFYDEILYRVNYTKLTGAIRSFEVEFISEENIDAAYEMLCWCIERGHIVNKEDGK